MTPIYLIVKRHFGYSHRTGHYQLPPHHNETEIVGVISKEQIDGHTVRGFDTNHPNQEQHELYSYAQAAISPP